MTAPVKIQHANRLGVLLQRPKKIKILVGGRASTKSTFTADVVLAKVSNGQTWCCGREYQNSIDDSVHSLLKDEIERLELQGFTILASSIEHISGGSIFYKGLARNITSLKGIHCHGLWIEEGEATSDQTLRVLTASVRVSAKDQQAASKKGAEIEIPETWITMNRGSSKDPIAQRFLKRAERDLSKRGFYEDDFVMVVEVNYDENPWFEGSGLRQELDDDKANMTSAEFDHKWIGKYSDTVPNAIIQADWFDACIDAHIKLGFKPEGIERVVHDPFDGGSDPAAICYRHGSVILDAKTKTDGRVNEACDWALDYAHEVSADEFIWDADGIGAGLRAQIDSSLKGKKMTATAFNGGHGVDDPQIEYMPMLSEKRKSKTNKETFFNRRAQYYWMLRDRVFKTYLAVTQNTYTSPDEMISFSSKIEELDLLRSEVCRIPKIPNGAGKIQIMSKKDMAVQKPPIDSPNMGDTVMMSLIKIEDLKPVRLGSPTTYY